MNTETSVYDMIVIGTGPGGLATAHTVTHQMPESKILMLEAGRPHHHRYCPVDVGRSCTGCGGICNVISGFGGCMHYGDGIKLSLMLSGRRLMQLFGEEESFELADRAFDMLMAYTEDKVLLRGHNIPQNIHDYFAKSDLTIREYPVAIVSETALKHIIDGMYSDLSGKVELRYKSTVVEVDEDVEGYQVTTHDPQHSTTYRGHNVVLAVGRRGIVETKNILEKLAVPLFPPKLSIGVRLEMRSRYLYEAGLVHPDLKISQRTASLDEKTKTFCFCGGVNGGRVKFTNYQDTFGTPIITLDGHETCERVAQERELAGNFGLMCQISDSVHDSEKWLQEQVIEPYLRLSNGRPMVQSLRTFQNREPEFLSWPMLRHRLPFEPSVHDLVTGPLYELFSVRDHTNIINSFHRIMPPILQLTDTVKTTSDLLDEVLVLGPEIEFAWHQVDVDCNAETPRRGLFVVGDAAGLAQGVIQAMMMGLKAGERVASRMSQRLVTSN